MRRPGARRGHCGRRGRARRGRCRSLDPQQQLGVLSTDEMRIVAMSAVGIWTFSGYQGVLTGVGIGKRHMVPPNVAMTIGACVNFAFSIAALLDQHQPGRLRARQRRRRACSRSSPPSSRCGTCGRPPYIGGPEAGLGQGGARLQHQEPGGVARRPGQLPDRQDGHRARCRHAGRRRLRDRLAGGAGRAQRRGPDRLGDDPDRGRQDRLRRAGR